LLNAAPETPAQAAVEAMNSIMDIYSDAEFEYDRPVFVELEFLKYLETAVPKVRTLVIRPFSFLLMLCYANMLLSRLGELTKRNSQSSGNEPMKLE
jgi:hypothetical protein